MRGKRYTRRITKYEPIDPSRIWQAALDDLFKQHAECLTAKPDQMRFQHDRLYTNLSRGIEQTGKEELVGEFLCYRFITHNSLLFYEEPLRLHSEEMQAAGLASAHSFCKDFRKALASSDPRKFFRHIIELAFRLSSIASWMEAREAFSMWLSFKEHRTAWQGDLDAQARAIQARILATLPRHMLVYEYKGRRTKGARLWEGRGVGTNYKGDVWTPKQWANILKQAAKIAEKKEFHCTPLERWVWWCFPVFQRYGWNWREVKEAAHDCGLRVVQETAERFRRHWLTLGLHLTGRKTSRKEPPFVEFVRNVSIPKELPLGFVIWG